MPYTQPLLIRLDLCPPTGTYLRWLSPLGNLEGWLFSGDDDQKTEVRSTTSWQPAGTRRVVAVRRPGYTSQVLYAGGLDTLQVQALTTLLDSPQVYLQDYTSKLTPVYLVANSAQFTPHDGRHELSFELELPARNALTN